MGDYEPTEEEVKKEIDCTIYALQKLKESIDLEKFIEDHEIKDLSSEPKVYEEPQVYKSSKERLKVMWETVLTMNAKLRDSFKVF